MMVFSARWMSLFGLLILLIVVTFACNADIDPDPSHQMKTSDPEQQAQTTARQVDAAIEQFPEEIRGVVERLEGGRVRLGGIEIDPSQGTLGFDGRVNMNEGLIEVIICTPWGKTHESLFVADVRPMFLHASCLLLGFRHGRNPAWLLPKDDPDLADLRKESPGETLVVEVRWEKDGRMQEAPVGLFLMDESTGETLDEALWVFVGSYIDPSGVYAADEVGSIVTNFHDFSTVIDLALDRGQLDDFMFANNAVMPEPGTPVRIIIKSLSNERDQSDE